MEKNTEQKTDYNVIFETVKAFYSLSCLNVKKNRLAGRLLFRVENLLIMMDPNSRWRGSEIDQMPRVSGNQRLFS